MIILGLSGHAPAQSGIVIESAGRSSWDAWLDAGPAQSSESSAAPISAASMPGPAPISVAPLNVAPPAPVLPLVPGNDSPPAPLVSLGVNFEALPDDNTVIPPHTNGAAGPNHLMTMLNTGVLIQDKSGATVSGPTSLATFWTGGTGLTGTPFQPRLVYDQDADRWLATARDFNAAASQVYFAISDTNDPTGAWSFYAFVVDGTGTNAPDFPAIGFNGTWIAITANVFPAVGGSFVGAQMWVIDKSTAPAPGGPLTVATFTPGFDVTPQGIGGFTLQPCVTFGASSELFIIDNPSVDVGTQALRLSQITGTGAAPVWSVVAGSAFAGSGWFGVTNDFDTSQIDASQSGTSTLISTNDTRIASNAVFRNGAIWATHSGGLPVGAVDRTAAFWYQIDPTLLAAGPILQSGVLDGGLDVHHMYPSIAVNANDDVCIGFTRSDATRFAEAVFTGRMSADAPGATDPITVLKAGEDGYEKDFSLGTVFWGETSSTVVDPTDDLAFWTLGEYAATDVGPAADDDRWGTWWGTKDSGGGGGPLNVFGLDQLPLGAAVLADLGGILEVSNIGSSGLDGVSTDVGAAEGLDSEYDPPIDLSAAGASVSLTVIGSVGGVPDTVAGTLTIENPTIPLAGSSPLGPGGSSKDINVDSTVGANVTVVVCDGTTRVTPDPPPVVSAPGTVATVSDAGLGDPKLKRGGGGANADGDLVYTIRLDKKGRVNVGGMDYDGDKIVVTVENAGPGTKVDDTALHDTTAMDIGGATVTFKAQSVQQFGNGHESLGNARIKGMDQPDGSPGLRVSNIGTSFDDGVKVTTLMKANGKKFTFDGLDFNADDDRLSIQPRGTITNFSTFVDVPVFEASVFRDSGQTQVRVDFTNNPPDVTVAVAPDAVTVQIIDADGKVVDTRVEDVDIVTFRMPDNNPTAGKPKIRCVTVLIENQVQVIFETEEDQLFVFGSTMGVGRKIVFTAKNPSHEPSDLSGFQIKGKKLGSFDIIGEDCIRGVTHFGFRQEPKGNDATVSVDPSGNLIVTGVNDDQGFTTDVRGLADGIQFTFAPLPLDDANDDKQIQFCVIGQVADVDDQTQAVITIGDSGTQVGASVDFSAFDGSGVEEIKVTVFSPSGASEVKQYPVADATALLSFENHGSDLGLEEINFFRGARKDGPKTQEIKLDGETDVKANGMFVGRGDRIVVELIGGTDETLNGVTGVKTTGQNYGDVTITGQAVFKDGHKVKNKGDADLRPSGDPDDEVGSTNIGPSGLDGAEFAATTFGGGGAVVPTNWSVGTDAITLDNDQTAINLTMIATVDGVPDSNVGTINIINQAGTAEVSADYSFITPSQIDLTVYDDGALVGSSTVAPGTNPVATVPAPVQINEFHASVEGDDEYFEICSASDQSITLAGGGGAAVGDCLRMTAVSSPSNVDDIGGGAILGADQAFFINKIASGTRGPINIFGRDHSALPATGNVLLAINDEGKLEVRCIGNGGGDGVTIDVKSQNIEATGFTAIIEVDGLGPGGGVFIIWGIKIFVMGVPVPVIGGIVGVQHNGADLDVSGDFSQDPGLNQSMVRVRPCKNGTPVGPDMIEPAGNVGTLPPTARIKGLGALPIATWGYKILLEEPALFTPPPGAPCVPVMVDELMLFADAPPGTIESVSNGDILGTTPTNDLLITICDEMTGAPLKITRWQSVKAHGVCGDRGIELDAAATANGVTTEPRQGGGMRLLVDFNHPVSSLTAGVQAVGQLGTVDADAFNLINNDMRAEIYFTAGLPTGDCYTVDLGGHVTALTGDTDCQMRVLDADVDGNGIITVTDAVNINARVGADVCAQGMAAYDIDCDGTISVSDVSIATVNNDVSVPCVDYGCTIDDVTPLTGGPGDIITITGSGFDPNPTNSVVFLADRTAGARVIEASSTRLTCRIGNVPQTAAGAVTILRGTSNPLADETIVIGGTTADVTDANVLQANTVCSEDVGFEVIETINPGSIDHGDVGPNSVFCITLTTSWKNGDRVSVDINFEIDQPLEEYRRIHFGYFFTTPNGTETPAACAAALAKKINELFKLWGVVATATGPKITLIINDKGGTNILEDDTFGWVARNKCFVTNFEVPKNLSMCKSEPQPDGRVKVGKSFEMTATFDDNQLCECCWYKQEVKGSFKLGPVGGPLRKGDHDLGWGDKLEEDFFREDCGIWKVSGITRELCYGRRTQPPFSNNRYSATQAKGCTYLGDDFPGITRNPPFDYVIDLTFRGSIIDVCNDDRVVASNEWTVQCGGTALGPAVPSPDPTFEKTFHLIVGDRSTLIGVYLYPDATLGEVLVVMVSIKWDRDTVIDVDAADIDIEVDGGAGALTPIVVPDPGPLSGIEMLAPAALGFYEYDYTAAGSPNLITVHYSYLGEAAAPIIVDLP